jgi:hypothetical protein
MSALQSATDDGHHHQHVHEHQHEHHHHHNEHHNEHHHEDCLHHSLSHEGHHNRGHNEHSHNHGHSHEHMDHPGVFEERPKPMGRQNFDERAFTVGIGGPVGTGWAQTIIQFESIWSPLTLFMCRQDCPDVVTVSASPR